MRPFLNGNNIDYDGVKAKVSKDKKNINIRIYE